MVVRRVGVKYLFQDTIMHYTISIMFFKDCLVVISNYFSSKMFLIWLITAARGFVVCSFKLLINAIKNN